MSSTIYQLQNFVVKQYANAKLLMKWKMFLEKQILLFLLLINWFHKTQFIYLEVFGIVFTCSSYLRDILFEIYEIETPSVLSLLAFGGIRIELSKDF